MWQDIGERIRSMSPWVWAGLIAAAALGYGARPIVRRLRFIPEKDRETAVLVSKSAGLAIAVLSLLLATGFIGS